MSVKSDGTVDTTRQYSNFPKTMKAGSFIGNTGALVPGGDYMFFSGNTDDDNFLGEVFLLKTDAQGDSIWMKTYGTDGQDVNRTLLARTDSTLWVFSEADALADDHIWLMEVDMEGNVLWEGFYGDEYGQVATQDIVQLPNGDLAFSYMACPGPSCFTDSVRMAVTLVGADGQKKWTRDFAPLGFFLGIGDTPNGPIVALDNGGFVVGAERNSSSLTSKFPPILVWLDADGNVTQQYDFQDDFPLELHDLMVTSDGTIIGCGQAVLFDFDLGIGGWVFAFSQDGDMLWERYIADGHYPNLISYFNAVTETPDGGLALTGTIRLPAQYDVWLVKLDSTGCFEPGCADGINVLTGSGEAAVPAPRLFHLFPNPATQGQLHFQAAPGIFPLENHTLKISDSLGRSVFSGPYAPTVDVSGLRPGLYFVQIVNTEGEVLQVEKVVVGR